MMTQITIINTQSQNTVIDIPKILQNTDYSYDEQQQFYSISLPDYAEPACWYSEEEESEEKGEENGEEDSICAISSSCSSVLIDVENYSFQQAPTQPNNSSQLTDKDSHFSANWLSIVKSCQKLPVQSNKLQTSTITSISTFTSAPASASTSDCTKFTTFQLTSTNQRHPSSQTVYILQPRNPSINKNRNFLLVQQSPTATINKFCLYFDYLKATFNGEYYGEYMEPELARAEFDTLIRGLNELPALRRWKRATAGMNRFKQSCSSLWSCIVCILTVPVVLYYKKQIRELERRVRIEVDAEIARINEHFMGKRRMVRVKMIGNGNIALMIRKK